MTTDSNKGEARARVVAEYRAIMWGAVSGLAELPELVAELQDILQKRGWSAEDFIQVCRKNGWISENAKTLADITISEFTDLQDEWRTVEREMNAAKA